MNNHKIVGKDQIEKMLNSMIRGKLDMNDKQVQDQTLKKLSQCKTNKIRQLSLWNNRITSKGILYISKADFSNLIYLQLSQNRLLDRGVKNLVKGNWPYLQKLNISKRKHNKDNIQIGSSALCHLKKINSKKLTQLILGFNNIESLGMKALSKSDFKDLKDFYLCFNQISYFGFRQLLLCEWPNLEYLYEQQNNVSNKEIGQFRKYILQKCQKIPRNNM